MEEYQCPILLFDLQEPTIAEVENAFLSKFMTGTGTGCVGMGRALNYESYERVYLWAKIWDF